MAVSSNSAEQMFWKKEIDDENFAERFYRIARSSPSATCLINDEYLKGPSELTYATVYDAASRVQRALRAVSVESKQLVAIQMERGADLLISVLACLLNRSPFLLMEPSTSLARRNFLLNDTKAALLITDTVSSTVDTDLPVSVAVYSFAHLSNQVYESDDFSLLEPYSCDDTMYVIYTSGSTGQPKGVVVPYRAMYNRFRWMWTTYKWTDSDVQLWKTSVTFGDCIWEMLGGLLSGVPTVVASTTTIRDPCLLLDLIHRTSVTRATFIPTMLSVLIKLLTTMPNDCFRSLRHVIVSGEPLPKIVCKQFLALSTNALLLNLYGSTEIGNDATYYEVRDVNEQYDTIPIGTPIANMHYKIVDGELWIAGDGLASGYLNNDTMTAAKFVRHIDDGQLYFKTGDRVHKCGRTGQLHFVCRLDDTQVKIRGALINLAEVEAVCMQHSLVRECGCFVHETKAQLIALIYSSSSDLTISDLQHWLSSQLSKFEMPSVFVFTKAPVPRTATGKIDRKQLVLLYEGQKQGTSVVSTSELISDHTVQRMMVLWCTTLGIREEDETSSRLTFTELGGHSLLAIHLQCALIYEFGIQIPIEQFFCRTTVTDLIKLIHNSTSIKPSLRMIESNYQTAPLTLAQRSIWVADELQHLSVIPVYNVSCAFEILSVDITIDQLKKAIHILLQRHESLRMIFSRNTSGEIYQTVSRLDENLTVAGTCLLQEVSIENVEETTQILTQLATFKFNLDVSQPLCRFFVCSSSDQRILTIVLHHVIVDGWSIAILKRDLNSILISETLPSIGMQFPQYAQLEYKSDPHALDDDLIFWKNKLNNGALTATRLPHDHETLHIDRAGHVQIVFPSDLTDLIRTVSKTKDVTPFMILLTTFSSLLARYTNETDIIVGLPVANRILSEVEHTVGLFMNTVVVRTDLTGTPTFLDLLSRVKMTVLDAFAHQSLPFVRLMSELEHLRRDQHQDALFHILFAYQNIGDEPMSVIRNIRTREQAAKFELDIHVWTETSTMLIEAYFRSDLFDVSTIERLLFHWLHLTRSALTNSMDPYVHWSMVPNDEYLSVSSDIRSKQSNVHIENKNLYQLFLEQIERTPHVIAVEDKSVRLTYTQVWQRSTHFAHKIRQILKSSSNHCVAIRMRRGIDLIQTIWSVLLSGNYFVYIDPALPVERQQFIIGDTQACLLIIDGPECTERIPTIRFEAIHIESSTIALQSKNDPADLAYILYTSGSTGLPKGVCVTHQAIIARMVNVDYHSIRPETRVGQLSTFSFDMSTFELFGTLLNGGTLVIVAQELTCSARALLELQLDIISPSTAVLNILVQQELSRTLFASLRNVYFGGEKVNMKYLHRALEHQVLGKFVNLYGPTETTVFALFYKIDTAIPAEALTIPIGRPLPNTSVYIVDASFQLTPRGIPGELLIGGAGLSLGYRNHPDLTRTKFISNPFGHDLVYCTGDICRMRDDGTIEFLYRLDNQVKLRSQRLELTEIEFHLLKHELIADAIVLLRDDVVEDEKHLVGYVQPISSKNVLNSDQVRTFLAKSLPDYMVPSFIVIMPQLPLNHVGKIDKKSLPKPSRSKLVMNISDIVRQIFIQVLKQDEIDMNSGFFHLGGHSLSAMEIIGKLYEHFSIQITIPTLFQAQSIAEFVRHVETQISKDDRTQLTNVMETNNKLSNVRRAPLTPTQQQFWIFWKLKPDNCYYNVPLALEINGHLNMVALTRCLHHLMCKYTLLRIKFEEGCDGTQWQEENNDWNLPLVEEFVEGDLKTPRILERLQYHSMKPFDLSKGHVCRFAVLHMTENRHVLLINFHHIVCDGYSVSRFVNELLDLYALGNSNLPTTSSNMMSFLDYATRISKISRMDHHLDSMVNYLRDFRSLTFDTNLGVEQGRDVGLVSHISSFTVPSEVAEKLRQLAKEHACTLYTVLLALFECFLSVYSYNASDIVLGSIMSTRSEADVNDLFGPLINTVPIHTRLPDNTTSTFIDVLHSVRASVLFAMEHQMVPFADIVQRLRLVNTDHSLFTYLPVFRVLFEMNSYKLYDRTKTFSDATEWKSLNAAPLLLPYTKSDIDLEIMNYGDGQPVQVTFNGNRALFESNTVNAMANCYRCAIETVVRQPTCSRTYLWRRLNMARKNSPPLILHERFREQAAITPDQRAVIYESQTWTYAELLKKAEEIASHLCEISTNPGQVVGLYMKRCAYLLAAMFGVLIAGATYLYLDPELPDERICIMLEDAAVQVVIEDKKESVSRKSIFKNINLLSNILNKSVKGRPVFPVVKPSDYCYLIYTSGSTGKPKGVKIQHQAVVRRMDLPIAVTPSSNVAQLTSCSFDVYILEVYGALLNGATLVIYDKTLIFQPKLLSQQIALQRITHMYLPTPIFNLLAEYVPNVFANMECVLMAGDRANSKLMRAVLQTSEPPKRLINAYGPTETTCITTWYDASAQGPFSIVNDAPVPIGQALPNTLLYIANPTTLELVVNGEEGELLIGGYGVSDGYINNKDETEAKFLVNRYADSGKIYRTGDLVRQCQDGNLQFLGRIDTQVKVNGHRIDLMEIEHVLQGYPTIVEAVVIIRDNIVPDTQSIVAYVRPAKQIEVDIRRYLSDRLPAYMLPSFIVPIDEIPINSAGGKRDIKNLPPVKKNGVIKNDYASVEEAKVQTAWNNVLNPNMGPRVFHMNDDFFACGGTSINIVKLHKQLESLFGLTLDVGRLFEFRTVSTQVVWLASLQPAVELPIKCPPPDMSLKGIAIIGMSARYGPIETVADLWTALRNGTDCCTRISNEELIKQNPSMARMIATNPNYVHAGCTMSNAYCFDHTFFGMTKRDADITDPQHRIMLEATYEALENAGLVPQAYKGTIGMFGAIFRNTYADCYNLLRANPYDVYDATKERMGITTFDPATVMRVEIGNMIDGAPTFVSYKLGLNGPSMAIQTACSSSGTALHMALRSLEAGDCTVAIVAGACITFPLDSGYNYQPGMIMSKTGTCRSFDESADGAVGGDGVGVVVLMKTTEAASDGYPIRAIITGHAINNDGQNKPTYSTTSPVMQASCMRRALATAQIQHAMEEIDYIEAHGPGVQMGDLLEIQALIKAYADDDHGCTNRVLHLGSIKTNVGHTAHAATLAGLLKIVLSLEAGELPPTLNFHRFNSMIAHMRPPFTVNTRTIPWPTETNSKRPRRAALNALGQGGTNTHFIVEQGLSMSEMHRSSEHHIFLFSAKTDDALSKVKQRLLDYLSKTNDHQLPDIAFTLACGRINYEKRDFAVASSIEELKQQLLNPILPNNNDESTKSRIVFVFPGQGSQYQGMARYLYDRFPHTCAPVIDTCLRELHNQDANIHRTVTSCLFDETYDDRTVLAQYAQLTLFIVEYTLATFFLSLNIHPDYLVGHSSGEFVAACIAKVMTVENAVRLLAQRCQLMVTASPGAMLAVEVNSKDDLQALSTTYDVELAVINSATQHVYSGTTANIRKLEIDLRNRGCKVKMLSTLTGFHSRLMDPICQKLKDTVQRISLQEPTIPIVSTMTARLVDVGQMTSAKYWCDHLRQPVLFGPCLSHMLTENLITNDKSTIFIPVGPGKVLQSLLLRAAPKASVIRSPLLCGQSSALLYTLGSIWTKNLSVNWLEYFHGTRSRRIPLPTYPFARTICVTNDRATLTTTNNLVDCSNRQSPSSESSSSAIGTSTDLFEILDRRHAVREPIECKSAGKKTPPWKITKHTNVTVKLLDQQCGTFTSVEVAPTIMDEMQLNLGSSSFLFVQALYYEALETGRLQCSDSLMKFLPVEHRRINLSLTIDDLMQSKINTTTRCSTPDDLLTALQQVTIHASNGINHVPNVFAISLLGHILAALYEMSYDELLHDHIVIPLGLKQTCLDVATSSQAYYPATGVRSSIADLQTMMTSTVDSPISKAIRKALTNWHAQFTGAEQLIMTIHPNDSNKSLILASQQPLQKAFYKSLIEQMQFFPSVQLRESSINYEDIVQSCLVRLLGLSDHTMTSNFSSHTSFEQLGIDSLQAITFAEQLSQKLGIELPIDVIFQYPNVKSLASRLKQIGSNSHSSSDVVREYILHEKAGMPRVYEATNNQCSLSVLLSFVNSHKVELLQKLHECGALLFRGFEIKTAEEFSKVVELLADKDKTFLDYRDGISPRTRLTDKIFTSTDYPKQFNMALHNEMSYSYTIPSMIFFFCQVAPNENDGGETPIGDSTAIYNAIDPNIRREFSEKKLVYVTNLPSKTNSISLGKSWQETYQTDSKAEVEAFLKDKQIQFKWLPNDRLRTLRRGDAIRQHPITGATVWCNHAHLFHPTDLDESTRQALQKRLDPLDMPKNCFFGNGDPIPDASLSHIRQVLKQHEVKWPWHKGDILVLDNVRTAHGRASFDGQRRILVAMC